jgi:hypothetical protein
VKGKDIDLFLLLFCVLDAVAFLSVLDPIFAMPQSLDNCILVPQEPSRAEYSTRILVGVVAGAVAAELFRICGLHFAHF